MPIDLLIVRRLVRGDVLAEDGTIGVDDLPGDWRVWFEERAAIREYDGGLPRERAEAEALKETVRMMKMKDNRESA